MTETGDGEVELAVVAGVFDARPGREAELGAVLARYVVLSRGHPGCRNIDLVTSLTTPGRFLVYEKWESPAHQRSHMASAAMSDLADDAAPLLAAPPELGLYEAISAHDLLSQPPRRVRRGCGRGGSPRRWPPDRPRSDLTRTTAVRRPGRPRR